MNRKLRKKTCSIQVDLFEADCEGGRLVLHGPKTL